MTIERALITGGGGQLASDLAQHLEGRADVAAPSHAELDVTDAAGVDAAFERHRPDAVFNCAAFHNVDVCETEEDSAYAVNAIAVKHLARSCRAAGARLVHLSTNYVFDGTRERPYRESDEPSPQSVYAISKLAGEYAAFAYAPDALVVRTAGLYGLTGSASKGGNFVTRMIDCARRDEPIRMVSDHLLTPTFTADLSGGIVSLVEAGAGGVAHLTNAGSCSWLDFTEAIMGRAGITVDIEPVTTDDGAGKAQRPRNGVMESERDLPGLRSWDDALTDYMARAGLAAAPR